MQISGFGREDKVISVENFVLHKRYGQHSSCSFTASIYADDIDTFMNKVDDEITVTVEDGTQVFCGFIESVTVQTTFSCSRIDVCSVSYSFLEDEDSQWRIFQNPQKTFGQVMNSIKLKNNTCKFLDTQKQKLEKQIIVNPILQNRVSNFELLKSLACQNQATLWVKDTNANEKAIIIGDFIASDKLTLEYGQIRAMKRQHARKGSSLLIKSKVYCPLGHQLQIGKTIRPSYVITDLKLKVEHGLEVFSYELQDVDNKYASDSIKEDLEKSEKLMAVVTDNKDPQNLGRVRVHFLEKNIVDDAQNDEQMWISYRSPYSGIAGGFVFIPDVNDKVEIVYNSEDLYAVTTYREKQLDSECQNIDDKYIGNNTQQRIFWKKDSLELHSFENNLILDKDKVQITVGESTIIVTKDCIELKSQNNILQLNSDGIISKAAKAFQVESQGLTKFESQNSFEIHACSGTYLKSDNNIEVKAEHDTKIIGSASVNINAGSTANLNGSSVNISGSPVNIS